MRRFPLGSALRTLRHLRARQLAAQLQHRLGGGVRPLPAPEPLPTRAVARPAAPFLPGPAHARWDGALGLELLNQPHALVERFDWDTTEHGPLWAFHLHQHEYLRHAGLAPERRRALIEDWIQRHPEGTGWQPHPLGLRSMSWIKLWLEDALALDAEAERTVRRSLAAQVATLAAHLELHLLANHYLSNLLAVVFAGLALEGPVADAWLSHEGALRGELAEQVPSDGAHYERSPMYHAHLLEHVLDLVNLAAAGGRAPTALASALREAAARMLGALRLWTHPDGEIALFGDSALGFAPRTSALEDYARALGIEPRPPPRAGLLADAGYARLEAGPFVLIASLAGPMPAYQPGHAHADALAFELSVAGERVVTDTGVFEYVAGPRRTLARATRAHATVEVDGRDQAELWAPHRVGGRPRVRVESAEPPRRVTATCAGWATPDSLHRRELVVDERAVEIRDQLEGRQRPVRMVLPLAPGVRATLDGGRAELALPGGTPLRLELPDSLHWRHEQLPYFPEFHREVARAALVGEAPGLGPVVTRVRIAE